MRILFQGDSITDAFRKPGEINPAFQLGNGYAFLVAAHLGARHPGRNFEFFNRGISGHRVQDLAARWSVDALDLDPDVLSLLVGVNNVIIRQNGNPDISDMELLDCYRGMLEESLARNPDLRLILLEPFLLEAGEVEAGWREDLQPIQEGFARLADDFGVPLVPLQGMFDQLLVLAPPSYWAYDGIHPTHAGFQKIADAWLDMAESHQLLSARPSRVGNI